MIKANHILSINWNPADNRAVVGLYNSFDPIKDQCSSRHELRAEANVDIAVIEAKTDSKESRARTCTLRLRYSVSTESKGRVYEGIVPPTYFVGKAPLLENAVGKSQTINLDLLAAHSH
jgi:hypothetical protein